MKMYKNKEGEIFAYDESDIQIVESIAKIEVAKDESALAEINPVYFSIRDNIAKCRVMTPEEIEAHLNPPAQPYVPQQVTRAQGKAALITAGLWADVLAFVESITDPTEKALALVALNDTTHWQRTSPFLNGAATALGLTEQQLDDLFVQAAEIEL